MIEQTHAAGSLGDLPLVVLAALTYPEGPGRETERALQMELAALSTNSIYEEIAGAGHMTLVTSESFAQIVNAVIIRFVEAARLNP
jgi:hypothetical protein